MTEFASSIKNADEPKIGGNAKSGAFFPISLAPFEAIRDWEAFDADTGKDSAREIREYFIPDFSNWKDDDSYRVASVKNLTA